jgi:hypothetical protein
MSDNIKTHCAYCENETNQAILFKEFELGPQEIVQRNENGDQSQSAWIVLANIWNVSKCLGCDKINFKLIQRSSPDKELDKVFHFPKKPQREHPYWIIKLPIKYFEILREIYVAVNEGLYILSLNGIRTLLDVYIVSKIGDAGTFKQKIDELVTQGFISSTKASVLSVAIEAGNAAAHRGYNPDKETLYQILDIIENLMQSEIVDRSAENIKAKTPSRKK